MDVGAAERPRSEARGTGGELQTMNGTDAPDDRRSSSRTGIEKGNAMPLPPPPPPHVLLAAQACQSAPAPWPMSTQSLPDLQPIGTHLSKPRPSVPKVEANSRKR